MITDQWASEHLGPDATKDLKQTKYAVAVGFKKIGGKIDTSQIFVTAACAKCDRVLTMNMSSQELWNYRGNVFLNIAQWIRDDMKTEHNCAHAPYDLVRRLEKFRIVFTPPVHETGLILPAHFGFKPIGSLEGDN